MVVVAVIAILATMLFAGLAKGRDGARRIHCISRHKQISMGLHLFANDAHGYPFKALSVLTNPMPGLSPFDTNNAAELWKLFQIAAKDINSPAILVCPGDRSRFVAKTFTANGTADSFSHPNNRLNALSYFLSLEADERESQPQLILMGDRYLTIDLKTDSEKATLFLFGEQDIGSSSSIVPSVRWISTVHNGGGNVAMADGSAQQLNTAKLREALRRQPYGGSRIWLPNSDATGRGNP